MHQIAGNGIAELWQRCYSILAKNRMVERLGPFGAQWSSTKET
ncbi:MULTISPECIES: hypothetical protein [unclassified Paenibacillus]|nr:MULTISPECIES: hypothetical protein [unclassified Paenibacillus]